MQDYYFHGLRNGINNLERILQSGAILSKRQLYGDKCVGWGNGYNGYDYISLCKKLDDNFYINSLSGFYNYVYRNLCLIISNDINIVKPVIIDSSDMDPEEKKEYLNPSDGNRYSDMIDEYQVKDKISVEHIIGVGFPYQFFLEQLSNIDQYSLSYYATYADIVSGLNSIKAIIDSSDQNIFLYDSSLEIFKEDIKEASLRL